MKNKNMKNLKNFFGLTLLLSFVLTTTDISAQIIPAGGLGQTIQNGNASLDLIPSLVVYWIQWILSMAGGIAVIMVMYGGYEYIIGGTTDKKEGGQRTIIWALAGLFVAFFAWWLIELIQVWMTT